MSPELHNSATEALAFLTEELEAVSNNLPLVLSLLSTDNAIAKVMLAHMQERQDDINSTRVVIESLLKELDKYTR